MIFQLQLRVPTTLTQRIMHGHRVSSNQITIAVSSLFCGSPMVDSSAAVLSKVGRGYAQELEIIVNSCYRDLLQVIVNSRCNECEQQGAMNVSADGTNGSLYSPHGGNGLAVTRAVHEQ